MIVSVLQVPDVTRNGAGSQACGAGTRLDPEPGCNETVSESAWSIQGQSDRHQIGNSFKTLRLDRTGFV